MFKNNAPLTAREHGELKVLETNDYSYAKGELLSLFVFDEMADIAREYPIVFPDNKSDMPHVLLGLEPNQNAYVRDDGQWLATYIPAHIRRYPFAFAEMPAQEGQKEGDVRFALVFDKDAPHFTDPNGHRVFSPDGKLTPHMQERVKLLEAIQTKLARTKQLVQLLEKTGLLKEQVIRIQRTGQEPHQITGLRVIDEKKLNEMPDADFVALRNNGVLPMIYSHLLSWANFRQGPIAGKYPDLAAKPETKNPAFLFESDLVDMSGFSS